MNGRKKKKEKAAVVLVVGFLHDSNDDYDGK